VVLRLDPRWVRGKLVPTWMQTRLRAIRRNSDDAAPKLYAELINIESDPPLQALAKAIDTVLVDLARSTSLRGARLTVELADSLVHLDVVAGDFAGDSDRQLKSVATACVAELLGDAAQHHEIRWQLQADGKHLLIGAIAKDQLRVLADAASRHGLALERVRPDLCVQWNRHGSRAFAPGSGVFAVARARKFVMAYVCDGAIAAIGRGGWVDRESVAATVDAQVDRLLASLGLDAGRQPAFLMVVPDASSATVSPRWTVVS
jgi:hypothetical protein